MSFRSNRLKLGLIFTIGLGASQFTFGQDNKSSSMSGIELENFSSKITPGEDFFRYVNETWLTTTNIPPDQSNYGAFTALDVEAKKQIRAIIEEAGSSSNPSPIAKQVGNFYRSYTNVEVRNAAGTKPIKVLLDEIKTVNDRPELMALSGKLSRLGIPGFFGFGIEPDARQSDQYAISVGQDGTSLPDRDYYLEDDDRFREILAKYKEYLADMLGTIGWSEPQKFAGEIIELEKLFADAQWDKVTLRDPVKQYNKMTDKEFVESNPGLFWRAYAEASSIPKGSDLIIGQPSFFTDADKIISDAPIDTLKAYLAFLTVDTYAPVLSEEIERKHFEFHEKTLSGVDEQKELWRRGVDACNAVLGMPVGQLYVEKHFSSKAKERMNVLIGNLIKAFEVRIDGLEWMGQGTKNEARKKLSQFTPKIGYPDKWKDYSSVKTTEDDIVGNLSRISEFEHTFSINKLGKPIDRTEWFMSPQTVNAYYNPSMNEIVFPAAILQPPFFNLDADDAVNYGGIGAVIGHELSHGFDDSGSKYDGRGNLRNWWTENDQNEFERRASKLVSQYDGYSPFGDSRVNGKFTLGENIGDLGGLSVAFTAYKLSLGDKTSPVIDGFTGEQRFFIGWAQVWRRKYRETELRKRLKVDPHSPSQYRCNGIVSNLDGFYEAFSIKPDSQMFIAPEKRVRIW